MSLPHIMSFSAAALERALKSVCPIDGVSFGDAKDKSTWRIDFAATATQAQRAAAIAVLEDFDPGAPENQPAPPRDALFEFDALKAALIKKALVSESEIDAEKRNPPIVQEHAGEGIE